MTQCAGHCGKIARMAIADLRSDSRSTVGIAALLWLLVSALVFSLLLHERRVQLTRAEGTARALTMLMQAHTESAFDVVDLVLAGVVDAYQVLQPAADDPRFLSLLRERLRLLPSVRAIFIVDPDGHIRNDTDSPNPPRASLVDREYFQRYLDDPTLIQAISPPVYSRAGLGWFNAVTRRIVVDGRFAGVAVAAVVPTHFEALYHSMELGPGQTIELFYQDRTRVARYPADDSKIGRRAAPAEVFGAGAGNGTAGTIVTHEGLFHVRMTSWRRLKDAPFVVTLTQEPPSLLAPWRVQMLGAALAMGALTALLIALVVQLHRKRQIAARARQRIAQSERIEAVGQLTGGIAHDFANLLGIVRTNLAIIERLHSPDVRVRKALETAERAVGNARRLIDQLLLFARRGSLDVRPIDPNEALRRHLELLRQASGRQARVELVLDEKAPWCLADESQFVAAMVNLVANARDAIDDSLGRGSITVQTGRVPRAQAAEWGLDALRSLVRVSVVDSGSGIDEKVLAHVFEPFFTTKGNEGTGLGLAQVYGFVNQLGGEVRIESARGKGTAVHLFFPAVEPQPAAVQSAVATTPSETSASISESG
ncbi:MAG: ATP-binding protein [Burkholderiaceae bacterium]|nr:ATP-binding protein [Burkholderiaceae bacterium]